MSNRTKTIDEILAENKALKKRVSELERQLTASDFSLYHYPKIIENAPIAFTRVLKDTEGYALVNKEFTRQSGYTREEFNARSEKEILDTIHPDDRDNFLRAYTKWCDDGFKDVFRYMYRIINREGNILWLDVYYYAELDQNGAPYAVDQIYIDITDHIEAELKLKESEEKYKSLADSVPAAIFIYKGTKFVYGNDYSEKITGYTNEEMLSKNFWDLVHPDFRETIKQRGLKRQMGEDIPSRYEIKILDKHGNEKWLDYNGSVIEYESQSAVLGIAYDITELKKTQQALISSEEKYRTLVENMNEALLVVDNNDSIVFANENTCGLFGYKREDLIGKVASELLVSDDYKEFNKAKVKEREKGFPDRYEIKLNSRTGEEMWIQVSGAPLKNSEGDITGSIGILSNITDRKNFEDAIKSSLRQKELLLKEIHHRVKNNLQIISSLIKLQSTHLKGSGLEEIFSESQNRIRTMALIHEKLYRSSDLSVIEFYDYVKNLVYNLYSTYGVKMDDIKPVIDFRSLYLDIDTSIPCGLIINEVISNSLKYAFPNNRKGNIYINLTENEPQNYILTISDDGAGIPENITFENTSSLGLKLVKILSEQLSGKIELNREKGTEFKISFKKLNYLKRM
jgi:PAS domain S-box-containing protein